jgi:hypothetical protein
MNKEALTWVTNSASDSVTTLEEKLNNPRSNETSSSCHTHHLSIAIHLPFSPFPSKKFGLHLNVILRD